MSFRHAAGVVLAIRPLTDDDLPRVVELSLAAWAPVFASMEQELGSAVFSLVHVDWRADQAAAVEATCRSAETQAWVAEDDGRVAGFVATRLGEEGAARIGEIEMVAVDPAHQRRGVAAALMDHAIAELSAAGVPLLVLGTGDDAGHAPARALYERFGFRGLPLRRYYRQASPS